MDFFVLILWGKSPLGVGFNLHGEVVWELPRD